MRRLRFDHDGDIGRQTWTAEQADLSMKSRTDTSADQRRDFYCYIDEFGLFPSAGNSVDTMLSEPRKYELNLTLGMSTGSRSRHACVVRCWECRQSSVPVSYTHLTLPTYREV